MEAVWETDARRRWIHLAVRATFGLGLLVTLSSVRLADRIGALLAAVSVVGTAFAWRASARADVDGAGHRGVASFAILILAVAAIRSSPEAIFSAALLAFVLSTAATFTLQRGVSLVWASTFILETVVAFRQAQLAPRQARDVFVGAALCLALLTLHTLLLARLRRQAFLALDRRRRGQHLTDELEGYGATVDAGDLSFAFPDDDEPLWRALRKQTTRARRTTGRARDLVRSLEATSEELIAAGEEQMQGVSSQALSLSDMQSSLSEAVRGSAQVNELLVSVFAAAELNFEASEKMAQHVGKLDAGMREVDELLGLLDELAKRSDMLALTASLEATRTEQARPRFAAVARQMRDLANELEQTLLAIRKGAQEASVVAASLGASVALATRCASEASQASEQISLRLAKQRELLLHSVEDVDAVSAASDHVASGSERLLLELDELATISHRLAEKAVVTRTSVMPRPLS